MIRKLADFWPGFSGFGPLAALWREKPFVFAQDLYETAKWHQDANTELIEVLVGLVNSQVPSGDDVALLIIRADGSDQTREAAMEMANTLRERQRHAREVIRRIAADRFVTEILPTVITQEFTCPTDKPSPTKPQQPPPVTTSKSWIARAIATCWPQ